jgi:hypothetical protein
MEKYSSSSVTNNLYKKTQTMPIGTIIPGLKINGKPAPYPVLNERAIRATA